MQWYFYWCFEIQSSEYAENSKFYIKNSQPRGSYEGKGIKTNAMIFVLILIISKVAIINSIHSNEGKIANFIVTLSRDFKFSLGFKITKSLVTSN